jgi:hypothetical protein
VGAAVAVATGCGGGGSSTGSTGSVPPDRLAVTLQGGGAAAFRIDLDCAVADREACTSILTAISDAESQDHCTAAPQGGDASLFVSGTIGGDRVRSLITRRTDCEVRTYQRIITGLGL